MTIALAASSREVSVAGGKSKEAYMKLAALGGDGSGKVLFGSFHSNQVQAQDFEQCAISGLQMKSEEVIFTVQYTVFCESLAQGLKLCCAFAG